MKRMIAFLMISFLLCAAAFAEDAPVPCQHDYEKCPFLINEVRQNYIQEYFPEDSDAFYGYALCKLCSDIALLVADASMLDPEPCEPDDCIHRMYVLPDFSYRAWKTAEDDRGDQYDELRQYEVGVCMDCNRLILMHEALETNAHQMVEKQGFHIEGQYIHVTCEECTLCGMMTGELVPCISYEDGSCERSR